MADFTAKTSVQHEQSVQLLYGQIVHRIVKRGLVVMNSGQSMIVNSKRQRIGQDDRSELKYS